MKRAGKLDLDGVYGLSHDGCRFTEDGFLNGDL